MGSSGLPGLRGTIGASVVLNLYALRDLCNVIVAARDNNLLFKGLIIYSCSTVVPLAGWAIIFIVDVCSVAGPALLGIFTPEDINIFPNATSTLSKLQENVRVIHAT